MFNEVTLIGHLGSNPDLRSTKSGHTVATFSVAANHKYTNKNTGQVIEQTIWYRCTAWGKLAKICNQYLTKSRQVFIRGRLTPNPHGSPKIWITDKGEPRASYELNITTIKFLGSAKTEANSAPQDEASEDEVAF